MQMLAQLVVLLCVTVERGVTEMLGGRRGGLGRLLAGQST